MVDVHKHQTLKHFARDTDFFWEEAVSSIMYTGLGSFSFTMQHNSLLTVLRQGFTL